MAEFRRSAALPHVEARRSCQENTCYRPHTHDALSIGLIDGGTSVLSGALDGAVRLEPGDVVVIPTGHVHCCNPDGGRWLYQMTHMSQPWAASLIGDREAGRLFAGLRVVRRPELPGLVNAFNDAIWDDGPAAGIEAALAPLLRTLEASAPSHLAPSLADPDLMERLRPVLDRLRHDEANPALAELGALVGMSTHQLVRAMKRATGLAPLAWRQNARIVHARHLLRDGVPIADAAHELGFTDQSHFHRVFQAHVAAPPGAYRRR